MNRLSTLLTLTLALQLLISAALLWPRQDAGETDARLPLLALATDTVDRIAISDGDAEVVLRRVDAGWQLPDYHALPVAGDRIDRALQQLPALARGWPVANSAVSAERFEVAADSYQRRVEYFSGDSRLGTVYVGTSPGFRKVHARIDGSDSVFAVEFNSFDIPAQAVEWLDKRLLQVDGVTAVTGPDYQLRKDGDDWLGQAAELPDQDTATGLVNGLASLRVNGTADAATAEVLEEMAAPATLTAETASERYEFRLYEIEDAYYVQRSDIPVYFSLSAFDYDRLNDVNAESLYPAEAGEEDELDMEEAGEDGD